MNHLKLGTRKSLLAWAQSSLVAEALQRQHQGLTVELVGIVTQGDRQTDKPLNQLDGKDFFVKELDEALLRGDIDLCVHSFKDLSLERPAGLGLAAVPRREDPRDVILLHRERADARLEARLPLRIGTSSPRRLHNIPPFLSKALPVRRGALPSVDMVSLRGNVNTRLERLHASDHDPRQLDGVVLAFAGLNRLFSHTSSQSAVKTLLDGLRWLVLPLSENPTAPAQGALAIECRSGDTKVLQYLQCLDDAATRAQIKKERTLMAQWGGGCHQRFGISAVTLESGDELLFTRGVLADGSNVHPEPAIIDLPPVAWDGTAHKAETIPTGSEVMLRSRACFVASPRAVLSESHASQIQNQRVWVSGAPSWYALAKRGIWVEGCADGLGIQSIQGLLAKPVLSLPPFSQFAVLTHDEAIDGWPQHDEVHATYRVDFSKLVARGANGLTNARFVYWASGSQFSALRHLCRDGVKHACGAGKTAQVLRQAGIQPTIFVDAPEWRTWLMQATQ